MKMKSAVCILAVVVSMPEALFAHPGHAAPDSGFVQALWLGFWHPLAAPLHWSGLFAIGALVAIGRRSGSVWAWLAAAGFLLLHVYVHFVSQQPSLAFVYGIGLLLSSLLLCAAAYLFTQRGLQRLQRYR